MSIVPTQKEEDGHIDTADRAHEVQFEEFRTHRLERNVNSAMDAHDFRWRDQAAENPPHHHPHPVWLLVKNTAISVGERLHRLLVVDCDEGRGTDFSQAHQDVLLLAPGRLCLHELVLGALAFPRRHQLVDADEGGYRLRM